MSNKIVTARSNIGEGGNVDMIMTEIKPDGTNTVQNLNIKTLVLETMSAEIENENVVLEFAVQSFLYTDGEIRIKVLPGSAMKATRVPSVDPEQLEAEFDTHKS